MAHLRQTFRFFMSKEKWKQLVVLHREAFSNKYLLVTNAIISLGLSLAGDVLEQRYEVASGVIHEWDPKRSAHMAIAGANVGIICHYWYKYLDRWMPGRTIGVVMKKIFLDQAICSPVYITTMFVTTGMLEHKTTDEIWNEIQEKAWKLYAAEWVVWPPAQFINFYWVPLKYRIVYDNAISLGYDIYTSQVKHHQH